MERSREYEYYLLLFCDLPLFMHGGYLMLDISYLEFSPAIILNYLFLYSFKACRACLLIGYSAIRLKTVIRPTPTSPRSHTVVYAQDRR